MHQISVDEIIDYAKCPMYYLFKYKHTEYKDYSITISEKYNSDIHKVIYYLFSKVQEGYEMHIDDVKLIWGKLWIKDKRKSSIVFSDTLSNKDYYNDKRKKGFESLIAFKDAFNKSKGYPVIINSPYRLKITDNLTLTGSYELVREIEDINNNKRLEVCIFKTGEHTNSLVNKMYDIRLIASSLAIDNDFNYKDKTYMMYHVDKKQSFILDDLTLKEVLFKKSIINIYKAIKNNIFYIVPSDKCSSCGYKNICTDKSIINNIKL